MQEPQVRVQQGQGQQLVTALLLGSGFRAFAKLEVESLQVPEKSFRQEQKHLLLAFRLELETALPEVWWLEVARPASRALLKLAV